MDIKHNQLLGFIDGNTPSSLSSYNVLYVPSYVTSIANNAFDGVIQENSHIKLKFEKNSHCSLIGECAFRNCGGLTSVELPTCLTDLQNSCFENCMNVEHITGGFFLNQIANNERQGFVDVLNAFSTKITNILNGSGSKWDGQSYDWQTALTTLEQYINCISLSAKNQGMSYLQNLCETILQDIANCKSSTDANYISTQINNIVSVAQNMSIGQRISDISSLQTAYDNFLNSQIGYATLIKDLNSLKPYQSWTWNDPNVDKAFAMIFTGSYIDGGETKVITQGFLSYVNYKGVDNPNTFDYLFSINNIFSDVTIKATLADTDDIHLLSGMNQLIVGCNSSSEPLTNHYWTCGSWSIISMNEWIGVDEFYDRGSELNYLPSSTTFIGNNCFKNDKKIQFFNFNNCLQLDYIGTNLFEGCSNMKFCFLYNEIQSISPYMFHNCIDLLNVYAQEPNKIITINESAFDNCINLASSFFYIYGNFNSIKSNAFNGVSNLYNININECLSTIGSTAFNNTNLSQICFNGFSSSWTIPETWDIHAFNGICPTGTIYCVDGTISSADMLTCLKAKYPVFKDWN